MSSSSIHQEVWSKVRPYSVGALIHFAIYCITLLLILSVLGSSWLMLVLCNYLFHEVPFAFYVILYISDISILIHFIGSVCSPFLSHRLVKCLWLRVLLRWSSTYNPPIYLLISWTIEPIHVFIKMVSTLNSKPLRSRLYIVKNTMH